MIYEFKQNKNIRRMKVLAFFGAMGGIARSLYNLVFFSSKEFFQDIKTGANQLDPEWEDELAYGFLQITYYPLVHLIPLLFLVYNFNIGTHRAKKSTVEMGADDSQKPL